MSNSKFIIGMIFSILLAVFGVLIILNPTLTMSVITIFISIFIIITGISNIFLYITMRELPIAVYFIIEGIISIILGILIITNEDLTKNFLPYMIAAWLILKSITGFTALYDLYKIGSIHWKKVAFISVLLLAAGILIIFKPVIINVYLSFILGILTIIFALVLMIVLYTLKKSTVYIERY